MPSIFTVMKPIATKMEVVVRLAKSFLFLLGLIVTGIIYLIHVETSNLTSDITTLKKQNAQLSQQVQQVEVNIAMIKQALGIGVPTAWSRSTSHDDQQRTSSGSPN